ncbi:DMT family transporter [Candidatus Gottesmanbacteria bacterium]|nr:DMT family transporter [Candidatus Gottesmanbacteria bacterium]
MKKTPTPSYKSIILILLAAVVGGGISPITKLSLQTFPPISFTLVRFLLAAGTLLPFILIKKHDWTQNLKRIILVSLLATANIILFIFGVRRTTATSAQMLYAGVPLIAGIFSYLLLKEKIHLRKLSGILIGFVGVMIIVLLPVIGKHAVFIGDIVGNTMILTGVSLFALYTVLSKQFQKEYSPMELTIFFVLTSAVVQILLLPLDLIEFPQWWGSISLVSILGVLYVGVLGTGVFYLIYQHAIQNSTPLIASMILYLQPIFAYLWATVLLGERITQEFVVGVILSFIGVALVTDMGRVKK